MNAKEPKKAKRRSRRKFDDGPFTSVESQIPHYLHPVTIRELCNERHRFNIDPPFQRRNAWSIRQHQQLYETILLGQSIGILEGYKEEDFMETGTVFGVIDGHHRITGIYNFIDNKIKTWTYAQKMRILPNARPPVEPGRFFDELNLVARNRFLDYRIYINVIPKMSETELVERFLGIQNQTPLSPAERLYAYPSKAKSAAKRLANHPFWEDFYVGERNRGQCFQSSLYLLAIELTPGGIVDLTRGVFIAGLASGKYDEMVTDVIVEAVEERLDIISCVYAGMQFSDRAASIAMYQSIIYLEEAGCNIQSATDKGRLTNWITNFLAASKRASGLPVYNQPIHRLLHASGQREFWEKHRREVMTLFGLGDAA